MCSGSTAIAAPSAVEDVDSIRRARNLSRAAAPSGPCVASLLLHLIEAEERRARRQAPESIIVVLLAGWLEHPPELDPSKKKVRRNLHKAGSPQMDEQTAARARRPLLFFVLVGHGDN